METVLPLKVSYQLHDSLKGRNVYLAATIFIS